LKKSPLEMKRVGETGRGIIKKLEEAESVQAQ
jgi:hypothetical protein